MQLRLIPKEGGIAEWAMIELQGTLETAGTLSGQSIGELKWDNSKAFLHIGHHILEGKEVQLEKPFIALAKDAADPEKVQIVAIIRRKVQFRTRPKPVLQSKKTSTST